MADTQAPAKAEPEFDLLIDAAKQYEVYLKVAQVASSVTEPEVQDAKPYADWSHPIGLVVTGYR